MKGIQTILIFSAHPDDLDFGCAGTAAVLTGQGKRVVYCILTDGGKGVHKVNEEREKMVARRKEEQRAAAKAVGVSEVIFFGETDGELENTRALRKRLVEVILNVRPDVVIAPDPANRDFDNFYLFHRDHRIAGEAAFDAVYPAACSRAFFPELMSEDVQPHKVEEMWFYGTASPNFHIDISETLEKKLAALTAHDSQFEDVSKFHDMVREHAEETGKENGAKYAEVFRRLTY